MVPSVSRAYMDESGLMLKSPTYTKGSFLANFWMCWADSAQWVTITAETKKERHVVVQRMNCKEKELFYQHLPFGEVGILSA